MIIPIRASSFLTYRQNNSFLLYKLRWDVNAFSASWKPTSKVCHLIATSEHGLIVQVPVSLIIYLLFAIYCYEHDNEKAAEKEPKTFRMKSEPSTLTQQTQNQRDNRFPLHTQ